MHALVVEDDVVQSTQLERFLTARGYAVSLAIDVQSAWEAALEDPLDVILLDLNIPGGTGLRFLTQRNGSDRLRAVPVIVITCVEDPVVRRMAQEHVVEVIFSKPVDYRQLGAALDAASNRMSAPPAGTPTQ